MEILVRKIPRNQYVPRILHSVKPPMWRQVFRLLDFGVRVRQNLYVVGFHPSLKTPVVPILLGTVGCAVA